MTKKDERLIDKAESLHWNKWIEVMQLTKEAESEDARAILNRIGSHGYHLEEGECDMI